MRLPSADFESAASASSAIPAQGGALSIAQQVCCANPYAVRGHVLPRAEVASNGLTGGLPFPAPGAEAGWIARAGRRG
jgi:hypothetical protein